LSERSKMNPVAAVLDAVGFPKPDEVVPMPADVAADLGVPTIGDVVRGVKEKIRSEIRRM